MHEPYGSDAALVQRAFHIANEAVVADIQSACPREQSACGQHWYDTRPMLDPRELAPTLLDMNAQALAYALDAGLAQRHPERPYLLRIVQQGLG